MSRRQSDYAQANKAVLVVDWTDSSAFHRNRCGYRLILTKGWHLYAVDEADGHIYVYDTEDWTEWIRRIDSNLAEMFLYTDRYDPRPLLDEKTGVQLTLEQFLRQLQ